MIFSSNLNPPAPHTYPGAHRRGIVEHFATAPSYGKYRLRFGGLIPTSSTPKTTANKRIALIAIIPQRSFPLSAGIS